MLFTRAFYAHAGINISCRIVIDCILEPVL